MMMDEERDGRMETKGPGSGANLYFCLRLAVTMNMNKRIDPSKSLQPLKKQLQESSDMHTTQKHQKKKRKI